MRRLYLTLTAFSLFLFLTFSVLALLPLHWLRGKRKKQPRPAADDAPDAALAA